MEGREKAQKPSPQEKDEKQMKLSLAYLQAKAALYGYEVVQSSARRFYFNKRGGGEGAKATSFKALDAAMTQLLCETVPSRNLGACCEVVLPVEPETVVEAPKPVKRVIPAPTRVRKPQSVIAPTGKTINLVTKEAQAPASATKKAVSAPQKKVFKAGNENDSAWTSIPASKKNGAGIGTREFFISDKDRAANRRAAMLEQFRTAKRA